MDSLIDKIHTFVCKFLGFIVYCMILLLPSEFYGQAIGVTSPAASGSYCAGTNVSVNFTISGTFSNTPTPNIFSAEISDAIGSFGGSPVTIGTRTSTTAGPITCTLPSTLLTSALYRIRVISSNPAVNGSDNGSDLSIIGISLNSPTVGQASFCQEETFAINFSQSTCNFVNIPSANVYSVELSNASGSFTNPIVIGTSTGVTSGTISCQIPAGTAAGSGYRMRITASSPSVTGPDNGSNLAISAAPGSDDVFGNGRWNVYCYTARNSYTANYMGFYTETALSFNTTTRWGNTTSPSSANNTGGAAYTGCTILPANYSFVYKRTNIPCGYYQVDVPAHRAEVYMIINGTAVFSHTNGINDAHTNVFTGVIMPADSIEFRCSNSSSTGNLQVTFTKLNPVNMFAPVTVCASTTATLIVTNTSTLPVSFAWTPSVSVSPATGNTVIATPTITTTYSATGTDIATGCAVFTGTVPVTVNPLATTTSTITNGGVICSGYSNVIITASGANTYSWSPAAGLSATTGSAVVASPTITTTYTVAGSNNCMTLNSTKVVTVKNTPTLSPSTFGNGTWNVFCYNGTGLTDYYGYYTENNLSFDSRTRWAANATPSAAATTTAGAGYQGCNLVTSGYGTISKRTNFPCGYYRIDITHDDNVYLLINGVITFSHIGSGDLHTGAWTGFLGPSSTVEIRQVNLSAGSGYIVAAFVPVPVPVLSPPVTICLGSTTTFTAAFISGVSYAWAPGARLSATTGTITTSSATVSTNYTCTITDALTTCTAATTTSLTVNPLPTTMVSPVNPTINCQAETYTLLATGANTYSWSPSTGLSATSGNSVIASPLVNTIYTVTGDNNCATRTATVNVTVVPLVATTVVPANTWNAYCYNSTTFSNYYGYYTEDGNGASDYDFKTSDRWAINAPPSSAITTTNGQGYKGCVMPTTNYSMSFKRTGFTCNTYSLVVLGNDDTFSALINGVQVATRSSSSASAVVWVGVLSSQTTVELRLVQTASNASLGVVFVPATVSPSIAVWSGAVSNSWFNSSNWCGTGIPTSSDDVIIYNTGTLFQPVINAAGAECDNILISASTATSAAVPAASLVVSGAFGLDVYGDWINRGLFTPGTGTVSLLGAGAKSMSCTSTQTLNRLVINNTGPVTLSGINRITSNMDFLSGVVTLNGSLQFLNNSTATNASDVSYVEGSVVKFGNQAFTFPIGLGGIYRPISISAPVSVSDNFTAQYFYATPSPPYTSTAKDASIHHISSCEYWMLNRTGGSSIVNVTLSWDVNSCGITNINDLVVSRWDAGQVKWKDHGSTNITGNTVTGTLRSTSPITAFSPFTLGSKTFLNPLPVQLLDFTGACTDNGVVIKWSTASENNSDHFSLERSENGNEWTEIYKEKSSGNSTIKKNYSYTDPTYSDGLYYRLVQVDKDSKKEIFKTITTLCGLLKDEFSFYPNPARNEINVFFNVSQSEISGTLHIIDNLGQTCYSENMDLKKGKNLFQVPLKLKQGIYYISFSSGIFKGRVKKLIIQ